MNALLSPYVDSSVHFIEGLLGLLLVRYFILLTF